MRKIRMKCSALNTGWYETTMRSPLTPSWKKNQVSSRKKNITTYGTGA